ncbi:lipase [Streptomyces sp. MBT53]|uniref:alpha/beta hydrolase family protein n=1 Tax=Streptomyces sp. MBT53 TaxID=1488384 RepID=UPI00191140FE|nr:lipase [Streptomyces sp. MBT53]MBK6014318.1 lipase [Streptomyces sp. MBT53]
MVQIRYPAERTDVRRGAPWMTSAAARHFQSAGLLPAGYVVLPVTHAAPDAPARMAGGRRPVIRYSHGHGQHRSSSLCLVENLASYGYVVVTVDHTYDAGQVEFSGGRVETYAMPELSPTLPPDEEGRIVRKAVRVRVADVRYTLAELGRAVRRDAPAPPSGLRDIMDLSRTGMFGHSPGGATAAEAMSGGVAIGAGANLDGGLFGDVVTRGPDAPFLLLGADRDDDTAWLSTWPHLRGWRRFLGLTGAEHFTFTTTRPSSRRPRRGSGRHPSNSPPSSAHWSGTARSPCSARSCWPSSACSCATVPRPSWTDPARGVRSWSSGRRDSVNRK